jgi:hypothetical protein
MAVDVWRDYASKFLLDEFFNQKEQPGSIPGLTPLQPIQPTEEEIGPLFTPVQTGVYQKPPTNVWASLNRSLIHLMESMIALLEGNDGKAASGGSQSATIPPAASSGGGNESSKKTALQRINELVKARLTQEFIDELDEYGNRTGRTVPSEEYRLLQKRGLRVSSVSISNVRLHPSVQEQLIKSWAANWYKFAKDESDQLDLLQNLVETAAQERAQCEYIVYLSREIYKNCQNGNRTVKELLFSTLLRSRALIRSGKYSNSLRRRMFTELQDLDDMIKWLGDN